MLDDDSYVRSEIKYNLFDYARSKGIRYGFRMPVYEEGGKEFDALVERYLKDHPDAVSRDTVDAWRKNPGIGFYNNFFLADVSFFRSPPASDLLKDIDRSKTIFTHRTGDLVIQSAIVRLFARPEEVRWFRDFDYEHMTLCRKDKCGMLVRKGCVNLFISLCRCTAKCLTSSALDARPLIRAPSPPSQGAPRT